MLLFFKLSSANLKFSLYWFSFACILTIGKGYNFDTVNRKLFTDPNKLGNTRESYFGFSTALYVKTDNEDHLEASVLVGAPRANASAIPSVFEPGTVFNCKINDEDENNCIEWNLDRIGNGVFYAADYQLYQLINNSWTGSTIRVDYRMINNPEVVVCAPNWKDNSDRSNWAMIGMCYWSIGKNRKIFEEPAQGKVIPLLTISEEHCKVPRILSQAGFSMQLYSEKNQSRLLLGSPGMADGKGSPILINDFDYSDSIIPSCIEKQKLTKQFEYFGYSITSGIYHNDGSRWYAAGAPKSQLLLGKVIIFLFLKDKDELTVPKNYELLGTQIGEYFGASLASCDVNNDNKDEIIVGAPFWSNDMDEGRIYVFSENHRKFKKIRVIDGTKIGARFGSAVTCLGDLDNDGYKDIAIGAPYEENHGAVYIYNGNKQSLNEKFSQRIYGKDISTSIRGFGAAISEPRDVDGNHYVDIAIGAHNSGDVVLFRSQPVVTIKMYFSENSTKILLSNTMFFTVIVCSSYDGFHIPKMLDVETTLKVDPLRAFYGKNGNENGVYKQTSVVMTNKTECNTYNMTVVKPNVEDSIEIGVSLALIPFSSTKFCEWCPVVNEQKSKLNDSIALNFMANCGFDNECISIIEMRIMAISGDLENGDRYTLGSKSNVRLQVRVSNAGEPAFNAKLHFFIPSPICLVYVVPACESFENNGSSEVICTLGNRLEKDIVEKTFELDISDVRSDTEYIEFIANVSTQNKNAKDASTKFTIYFDVDVNMAISGKSLPDVHSFDNKDEAQEQKSMRSQHIYTVQKFGKSPIEESNVIIWVPTHLREKNIEVTRIIENFGVMDEQPIECQILGENEESETVDEMGFSVQLMSLFSDSLIAKSLLKSHDNHEVQESNAAENSNLHVPPVNRTFYLNCTNQAVKCVQISCKLNKFADSNTVAKIVITLDVQLQNLIPVIMKTKDIIYLVSNASVSGITRSGGTHQHIETEFNSTSIDTTFVGSPNALPVATWIIVVSFLFGILLLVLLILGLIKLGFFDRRKREELEALKAENDNNPGFVLATSSSEVPNAI